MINEMKVREAVEANKESSVELSILLGTAKKEFGKTEYKEMIEFVGLSKDAVSLSLKRFKLIECGFTETYVKDCTDRELKKITHKMVDKIEELSTLREKLASGEISYETFADAFDSMKPVTSDDEKFIKKAVSLGKFIASVTISEEARLEGAKYLEPIMAVQEDDED